MDMHGIDLEARFTQAEIMDAVNRIAAAISRDHADQVPVLVGVLKGCFVFLADLVRALSIPCEVDFIRARSYGSGTRSTGAIEITKDIETDLTGRHVVVVEDIEDTGLTMDVVVDRIRSAHPATVSRCALLVREGFDGELPDYFGMEVGPGFVVGYGIDYAERFRGLPDIHAVKGT
jgi:hypoxanthine phosphoribosyltransferase